MGREKFADLDRLRTEILKEKAETGLSKFKEDGSRQWVELRFEEPLLEKFLSLIEQAERVQELEGRSKKLLEYLAKIGNAIHEGEINGQGTDENFILQIVDDAWNDNGVALEGEE